jgi:hypothetical protein
LAYCFINPDRKFLALPAREYREIVPSTLSESGIPRIGEGTGGGLHFGDAPGDERWRRDHLHPKHDRRIALHVPIGPVSTADAGRRSLRALAGLGVLLLLTVTFHEIAARPEAVGVRLGALFPIEHERLLRVKGHRGGEARHPDPNERTARGHRKQAIAEL